MPCANCGANAEPGQSFCVGCGAPLAAAPPPMPAPPAVASAPPAFTPQPPPMPGPYAAPVSPAPAKKRLSTLAIVGIVIGGLLLCGIVAAGLGMALFMNAGSAGQSSSGVSPSTPTQEAPAVVTPADPAASEPAAPAADDGIVTDAEARDVVTRFMDLRLKMDVAGSKKLLSTKFLGDPELFGYVDDKYWRPDSYEIIKTTPDLMYIHVAVMGRWPSGDEPSIFSVWRDPDSGTVVIDGMFLNPEDMPELWK